MIPAATTLYVPATSVVNQQQRYFMIQPTPIVPAVQVLNGTYIYPRYGFVSKATETSIKKEDSEQQQNIQEQASSQSQNVQHVIHHVQHCSVPTCPGYCETCCPWIKDGGYYQHHRSRSRSKSPPQQHRVSRRDEYQKERDELHVDGRNKRDIETIDKKIERIRKELDQLDHQRQHESVGTIDHYKPPQEQQYFHSRQSQDDQGYSSETSQQQKNPRSRSRPRSSSTGSREPWRSSTSNEYPWRDAHLTAYREHTLEKQQDSDQVPSRPTSSKHFEGARGSSHLRSHSNQKQASNQNYVYRPKSEMEVKKWYTQSTGKDPDREVYQRLRGGTTTYSYNQNGKNVQHSGNSNYSHQPSYDHSYGTSGNHSFYSDVPKPTNSHTLKKLDSTQYHTLYGCDKPCLHIVPKQGGSFDPPYVKIVNAPVTYLH
ncbi:unnamed protein product [Didymodactylos carnosus]|uniref:Uncharacterized protein n=1 Tax=Didymodactylos carnosus TaxID=1234261 RepID=A0A813NSZ5_9BILA|nr:unnamed protein product [Didymodactylos carnosus]CAF0784301.1 unnamed protein product [Didymodactylos carnosus]CAF3518325.1 unnamed protein product [Didymodactylos carnosus]CAF3566353.1 unnamed protein product [Didymodactylos carnosus]